MSRNGMRAEATQPVWDRFLRLLHWSLAFGMIAVWISGRWFVGDRLHELLGQAVGGVVAARLVWGFVGPRRARFANFVQGRSATVDYARAVIARREPRYVGHNPLGAWMIVALLVCGGATALSGWLYTTEWLWGYEWLYQLHRALAWSMLGLIVGHVAGVIFTSRRQHESLVAAMIHGRKRPAGPDDVDG